MEAVLRQDPFNLRLQLGAWQYGSVSVYFVYGIPERYFLVIINWMEQSAFGGK